MNRLMRRLLLVPAHLTLAHLHDLLQAAMGWSNDHLHEFSIGQRRFGPPSQDMFMGLSDLSDEGTVPLSTVLSRVGAKAKYTYDFGDEWEQASFWRSGCLPIRI